VLERELTFVGLFAMKNDLRDKVQTSVKFAQKGLINVRMISGDNLETAKAVAIKAGIISAEDSNRLHVCMKADEFRQEVGSVIQSTDENGDPVEELQYFEKFKSLAQKLRVIGRAVPEDKHLMVVGLKQMGKVVASTGEGINDAYALHSSHVGFAMGTGCSMAKDNSDMIITDDNFQATVKAVMWGRNIYQNVKKFIQFQLTVNFACIFVVLFSCIFYGQSPMSAIQLLWVNLIMDTFAALALATEVPNPRIVVEGEPIQSDETVMSKEIWRQVIGMSLYMFVVLALMQMAGRVMFGFTYGRSDFRWKKSGDPTDKGKHYTMLF
jgi:P-type Ca2+ transporter type 2B